MKINTVTPTQKQVCMSYDSMDQLLNRQPHITNTLQSYLDRADNTQYIKDTIISMTEDKFLLTFLLDIKN